MSVQTSDRGDRNLAVAVGVGLFVLASTLALLRLATFDLTAFDAGIFDNVLWRLAHGYDDVTAITGAHHFSDHMSLLILFFVPIYALTPQLGLPALMVAQAASVSLVPFAAWLLAQHLGLDRRTRLSILLVTAAGAGTWNAALIDVHEVGLAVGPLAMTGVMAIREDPLRRYWIWPALAASSRLDIAVSVVLIGLLLRRERPQHARIALILGGVMATLMSAWLLLNPWEGTSFGFHFAHLGIDTATDLPGALLTSPSAAIEPLFDLTMLGTLAIWLIGFTVAAPLAGWRWILPALPTLAIPVLGSWPQADEPHLHYWHVLLPMLAIAMVTGLARKPNLGKYFFYSAVAGVAVTWVFMGVFKPSFNNDTADERAVVSFLEARPSESVASIGYLVPHVSQREVVMQLPTPFACPMPPVAHFTGPPSPPDLVALRTVDLESPANPATAQVSRTLRDHYRLLETIGDYQVWRSLGTIPVDGYDIVCGPESAENSS
ncbi:MAG: DUF2079 domain-containing protein [Acidimicrobiia bacterium]|nr:DUF2079 domain-containing protein [Acidimicrobiia bacterium]